MWEDVKVGHVYRHYRNGDLYTVVSLGRMADGAMPVIGYISSKTGEFWVRSVAAFKGEAILDDGSVVSRFARVT